MKCAGKIGLIGLALAFRGAWGFHSSPTSEEDDDLNAGFDYRDVPECMDAEDVHALPRILDGSCYTGKLTGETAVTEIPEELSWQYTRCGAIPVKDYLVDDTFGGEGSHYSFF